MATNVSSLPSHLWPQANESSGLHSPNKAAKSLLVPKESVTVLANTEQSPVHTSTIYAPRASSQSVFIFLGVHPSSLGTSALTGAASLGDPDHAGLQ